jgi:hypothetical protein
MIILVRSPVLRAGTVLSMQSAPVDGTRTGLVCRALERNWRNPALERSRFASGHARAPSPQAVIHSCREETGAGRRRDVVCLPILCGRVSWKCALRRGGRLMQKHTWSVARMMADIAILAVGLTSFLALRSRQDMNDRGVRVLGLVLALVLTVVSDRALFGRRHRSFWLGFMAAGWMCSAMAMSHLHETRTYLLEFGPPVVRARQDFQWQHIEARLRGVAFTPPVSEWYLLCSLVVEVSLGLILGGMVASVGGLFTTAMAIIARQASDRAHRSQRVAVRGNDGL